MLHLPGEMLVSKLLRFARNLRFLIPLGRGSIVRKRAENIIHLQLCTCNTKLDFSQAFCRKKRHFHTNAYGKVMVHVQRLQSASADMPRVLVAVCSKGPSIIVLIYNKCTEMAVA